jgi:hypothetical protein
MGDDIFTVCKHCQKELPSISYDYCSDTCLLLGNSKRMAQDIADDIDDKLFDKIVELANRVHKQQQKKCTCGAVKSKTTHSDWCDIL